MLLTDFARPMTFVLSRLGDGRVRQYWDPQHVLALQMAKDARPPQPTPDCCVRSGILWDLAAVYPKGAVWAEQMPPAVFFNGSVVQAIADVEELLR